MSVDFKKLLTPVVVLEQVAKVMTGGTRTGRPPFIPPDDVLKRFNIGRRRKRGS